MSGGSIRRAVRQTIATIAFAGGIAAVVVFFGTRDLESYEHAFFSLDRGTAVEAVRVLGHPVYTLSIGLGVRLPLQSSFGASPAAAVAPFLPAPVAYWLLLTWTIASTLLIVGHALEPLCGRLVARTAAVLLFCSVPMVTYTIYNDWPDVAFTYCALVASVFAPHALLALVASLPSSAGRMLGALSVAGLVSAAIALSHPGYWPQLAATLTGAAGLALFRPDHLWRHKVAAVALLAVAAAAPVAAQVPDILRELNVPGADAAAVGRYTEPPEGGLIAANLFPFGEIGPRLPFSHLLLAVVALSLGLRLSDRRSRRLATGASLLSIALAIGAATLRAGSAVYSPTGIWTLRDSAAAFAILGAAAVVAGLRSGKRHAATGPALAALLLMALQGPAYAVRLVLTNIGEQVPAVAGPAWNNQGIWTRDMTSPAERLQLRGLPPELQRPGERLALWPGVRGAMRTDRLATTDFADAGYALVTAWTKQRTMRGLVRPNELMFNQTVDLAPGVLCNPGAVHFLQLRYLLAPPGTACEPWKVVPGIMVDGRFELLAAAARDDRVRAVELASASDPRRRQPALSADSRLLPALDPMPGTSLQLEAPGVIVRLDDPSAGAGRVLVLPVAYDAAWRTSDGSVQNVGGLLGLTDVSQGHVTLAFVPDAVARLRAVSMTAAQLLALLGFLGLVYLRPVPADGLPASPGPQPLGTVAAGWRERASAILLPPLRHPPNALYLAYTAAVIWALPWDVSGSDRTTPLRDALLLPLAALATARLTRPEAAHTWAGAGLFVMALVHCGRQGSVSADAVSDPLFWAVVAAGALVASVATGRWPLAARTMAACAGASVTVAVLLPILPDAGWRPAENLGAIRASFEALAGQLGLPAALSLLGLCAQAIAGRGGPGRDSWHVGAAARAALLAALLLLFGGGLPDARISGGTLAVLGMVLGLAQSKSR